MTVLEEVVDKAIRALEKYPLCDHCLGRLFARLGEGLGNDERGFAIKVMAAMKLSSSDVSKEALKRLALNAGGPLARLHEKRHGERVEPERCYVCGGLLSRALFDKLAEEVGRRLVEAGARSFVVGVSLSDDVRRRELEVAGSLGFEHSESIKNEIKREVGKRVAARFGLAPDFKSPDAVALISFPGLEISVEPKPVYLKGVYWKLGRYISHVPWLTRDGKKKYPLSIQEFVESRLKGLFRAERVFIHAAGREDVDARMLGTGRPLVIEVSRPLARSVGLEEVNAVLDGAVVRVRVEALGSASDVRAVKGEVSKRGKVYKVLALSSRGLSVADVAKLEEAFRGALIFQRTPTRVLRRKRDVLRRRTVYAVKAKLLTDRLLEALIHCESGLYVKELVSCDGGRTTPCFGSVLGARIEPLELDVVGFA